MERIDWKDHWSKTNRQWVEIEEIRNGDSLEPFHCVSTGIVVAENKEVVVLALNIGENQKAADTMTILKSCIMSREVLGNIKFAKVPTWPV